MSGCPAFPESRIRCPAWLCDCFIDTYPDSPGDLHPEAFAIVSIDTTPEPGRDECDDGATDWAADVAASGDVVWRDA